MKIESATIRIFGCVLGILCLSMTLGTPGHFISKEQRYFPKELRNIKFEMSLKKVMRKRGELEDISDSSATFRKVFIEQIGENSIESVIYYFDDEGDFPLYEIIVVYESEGSRDWAAKGLLGLPNHRVKEWLFDIKGDYLMNIWPFQTKLIYAIPLDGTEWEDDGLIKRSN